KKPGISLAILEKGLPVSYKSYGYANLEYGIQNSRNTLFNATDLAKQITIFSILLLRDQGKLSVYDPVQKYLPVLAGLPHAISLKQLMEQTSGLRDAMELAEWTGHRSGDVITREDVLDLMTQQRDLNAPPGHQFAYNRTGFVLLTEVVAKVSGMPFSTFVQKYVFTPLGMHNSVFVNTHTQLVRNKAQAYVMLNDGVQKVVNHTTFVGGTNLYTSVSDFAKWLRNMSEHRIGKPGFYAYLHEKITPTNGQPSNYTAGIFKEDSEGYWRIHLEGFDHGYTGYMMYLPEYDFSLVYFSNDLDFPINDINPVLWDWFNTDYAIQPPTPFIAPVVKYVSRSARDLHRYTGNYLVGDNFDLRKVTLENDTLFYVRNATNRSPLLPTSEKETFKMAFPGNDNIRVTFKDRGERLEFRVLTAGTGNDYLIRGKKFSFYKGKNTVLTGTYRSPELAHTVSLRTVNDTTQLRLNDQTILLHQIGENAFLPAANAQVRYVKLQRDREQNITGVYLSGGQIKNLFYRLVSQSSDETSFLGNSSDDD
ncbi:MAG: serine hydrolase, partial [Bacteroidota bacterium]